MQDKCRYYISPISRVKYSKAIPVLTFDHLTIESGEIL